MVKKFAITEYAKLIDNPEYVNSYLSVFTPLEKSILFILYSKQSGLNVKQIQNEFVYSIIRTFRSWNLDEHEGQPFFPSADNEQKSELLPFFKPNTQKSDKGYHEDKHLGLPVDCFKERFSISDAHKFKLFAECIKKKHIDAFIGFTISSLTQKDMDQIKKHITSCGFSYPSFDRIKQSLVVLKDCEAVIERTNIDKKTKSLWSLNPVLLFTIEQSFNENVGIDYFYSGDDVYTGVVKDELTETINFDDS